MATYEEMRAAERQEQIDKQKRLEKNVKRAVIGIPVAIVALGTVFGSFYSVNQGERAVILTNGSLTRVDDPGLHFKMPFIQSAHFISTRVETVPYEKVMAYTFDQQTATLQLAVTLQVPAGEVERIYTSYGSLDAAVSRVVNPRVFEEVKNVFGQFSAQRAIQERGKLTDMLTSSVAESLKNSGIQVLAVQLTNIDYTDSYEQSVEAAARAKADVEKAKSELARVEQEAQQKVKQAEAEATAKKLRADAEAYSTEVSGKAEASAIRARGDALKDNPNLVALITAEKWNGQLPTSMIPGSTVPFVGLK